MYMVQFHLSLKADDFPVAHESGEGLLLISVHVNGSTSDTSIFLEGGRES